MADHATAAPYDAGDAPTGASFATYLTATERAALDARAATAEQERDDALDDLQRVRAELAAAQELIATVRDAGERVDRALAAYDTTQPRAASVPPTRAQEPAGQSCPVHVVALPGCPHPRPADTYAATVDALTEAQP